MLMKTVVACVLLGLTAQAVDFIDGHPPSFYPGSEFPGATGALSVTKGEIKLDYDFSKGGHYVAARFELPEKPVAREVSLEADCGPGAHITLRFVDGTGQTFQAYLPGETDGWETFTCRVQPSGSGHWGGANDGVFHQPLTGFTVIADNLTQDLLGGAKNSLKVRNIRFSEKETPGYFVKQRPNQTFAELARRVGNLRDDLARELPALEKKGLGAKTRATLSVMNDFLPWILEDVARGFTNRAVREAWEMVEIGEAAKARLQRIREGRETDAPVPHYVTSPIEISHAQMIAMREWPDGRRERGNVILNGFGHFTTIQRELDKMPPLGNHILQMEIGPNSFLPTETTVNTNAIRPFLETAARAAKENVQICLLLSPHYFPDWAKRKWPHLADCKGGFFRYCVYDPDARSVLEKSLRTVIPLIRGNPALHSVCLSNEPEQGFWGDHCILRREWPKWLAKRYGDVGALNAQWKTSYASLADVAMPSNHMHNAASPATLEFIRFSRASFTEFHTWMAGIVHEMAPELPVHAKIMIFAGFNDSATYYSVDPEDFAAFSQYNGNDACDWPILGSSRGWAHDWWQMEAGYDYQRSCADKPIFNTENHIIMDRSGGDICGDHVYTALWQNTVHGQAASTLWCWERAYDDGKSDFNGLFLERPSCLEAWSHASLDINRLADRLAPIQNQEPPVLILWSIASQVLSGTRAGAFLKCYRAANTLGQSLGVATERMLAQYGRDGKAVRPLAAARVVLLPDARNIPAEVRAGLNRLAAAGVKIVEVDRTRGEKVLERWLADQSAGWNLPDVPRVRAVDSDRGVHGVESRGYRADGKSYMTVVNHASRPVKARLPSAGTDLITGRAVPALVELPPLRPLFGEGN